MQRIGVTDLSLSETNEMLLKGKMSGVFAKPKNLFGEFLD